MAAFRLLVVSIFGQMVAEQAQAQGCNSQSIGCPVSVPLGFTNANLADVCALRGGLISSPGGNNNNAGAPARWFPVENIILHIGKRVFRWEQMQHNRIFERYVYIWL